MNKINKVFLTVLLIIIMVVLVYFAIERNTFDHIDYPTNNEIYAIAKEPNYF